VYFNKSAVPGGKGLLEWNQSVLESLGAKLGKVSLLSGGEIGETAKIALSIENLPLNGCQAVRPYARIVQNENLFKDDSLHVRDEFIFYTEGAAGESFFVSVIYPDSFLQKSEKLSWAIHEIWDALGLGDTKAQMQADLGQLSVSDAWLGGESGDVLPGDFSSPGV